MTVVLVTVLIAWTRVVRRMVDVTIDPLLGYVVENIVSIGTEFNDGESVGDSIDAADSSVDTSVDISVIVEDVVDILVITSRLDGGTCETAELSMFVVDAVSILLTVDIIAVTVFVSTNDVAVIEALKPCVACASLSDSNS